MNKMSDLGMTSDQVDAITHAYLDICATDQVLNGKETDRLLISEVGDAVPQTKEDLEKAFPWLLEEARLGDDE